MLIVNSVSSHWRWTSFVKMPSHVPHSCTYFCRIYHTVYTDTRFKSPADTKHVPRARSRGKADLWGSRQLLPRGLKSHEHCTVATPGARFSPLQLSSGVLMTPLMAAWAAAFCFFSSSIVFLNSFSSESLNKKKNPRYIRKCGRYLTAPFQSAHW